MAGFVDVVLRGLILVLTSVALGGVAWLRFVLRAEPHVKPDAPTALALRAMAAAGAGAALAQATVVLVGLPSVADPPGTRSLAAVLETTLAVTANYGVMVLSKVALLVPALALAYVNMRAVRRASAAPGARLFSFVEVELGLGITILFAAASLTSLPPAVDVTTDRASVGEVAVRFAPAAPRLTSPPIDELLRVADPLMGRQVERKPVERAWSEYNHHWAGLFVVTMGALAILHFLGVRAARHWPLVFLGLATFLFVRNDPRAWPLGPAGFWESLSLPDVLQHRTFVILVVAFAVFEWMVRTNRLAERPWGYVLPLLCAVGGGLLLTHSHAMFNLKEEFLTEVTHAPLGILGAFAGWGRWLEVRLPAAGRGPGWIWRGCFTAVGLILLFYREA